MRSDPLHGRVIVVTGSSRGIGREVARLLLRAGARVVLNGRNEERLAHTRADILRDTGVGEELLLAVTADLSTEAGATTLVEAALATFGRIDVLVNNAGVSMRGAIRDLKAGTVEALVAGTELAAVYPTVRALPALLESRGTVIFVSTAAALWGFPGVSWYSATKSALRAFAQALESEHRRDCLRVATVFLDFVENDPDKETLAADGRRFVHARKARITQAQAAASILRAIRSPRREWYASRRGVALSLAARYLPRVLAYALSRSGGALHRVEDGKGHGDDV